MSYADRKAVRLDTQRYGAMGNLVAWTILVVGFVAANYSYLTF